MIVIDISVLCVFIRNKGTLDVHIKIKAHFSTLGVQ